MLSMLHRLGSNATLTLANKKSIDIVVVQDTGTAVTVDVKGTSSNTGWFVDNVIGKPGHFVVFVCYLGKIGELKIPPEVYVVPSEQVVRLAKTHPSGKRVVHLGHLRKEGKHFHDAWNLIA